MDNQPIDGELNSPSRRGLLKIGGLTALGSAVAGALASSGSVSASMKSATAPHTGSTSVLQNRFSFEIDGVIVAGVHSIDGLESDSSVSNDPTSPNINTMTVTRDYSNTAEWTTWRKAVLDGKVDRRTVTVKFLNASGVVIGRINLFNCWPSKWVGPSLNSKSSGHATEKLEISWETMELKAG